MQEIWIRDHFKTDIAKEPDKNNNPINITQFDIKNAVKKMGKNKATSVDGVSDLIFQRKEIEKFTFRKLNQHFPQYEDNK